MERTSEAPDQAPEVEAHIWAGISADTEMEKTSLKLFIVSIDCAIARHVNAIITSEYAGGVSV